jgi:hypothetical protein
MNEPKRWLDGGEAGEEELALLRAARPPSPLGSAARSRSSRRVAALGVGGLPVAAAFGWWPALALGAVLGASGSLLVTRLLASDPPTVDADGASSSPSSKRAIESPAATPRLEPQPSQAASPSEQAAPQPARRAPMAASVAAAPLPEPVSADALQQEIMLLEQARRDLSSSPGTARLTLLEHERRFPSGHLRIERELLLVDALVHLGLRPEAEARAASLERQAPNSLYRERLDQILGRPPK